MADVDVSRMVPGGVYRVVYQQGGKLLYHEGRYIGREVAAEGDYLLFEHLPFGSSPFEVFLPTVREVETVDPD